MITLTICMLSNYWVNFQEPRNSLLTGTLGRNRSIMINKSEHRKHLYL